MTRHFHSVEKSIGVSSGCNPVFVKFLVIELVTSETGFSQVVDPYEGLG